MTINELIAELEKEKTLRGDCEVWCYRGEGGNLFPIESVDHGCEDRVDLNLGEE
jgi:hypothetical protein